MVTNKKGVTLIELLAYIAIIGIVTTLFINILLYSINTYDQVSGQGALNTEANNIMTKLLRELDNISFDYIQRCDFNEDYTCVDLVNEKEWQINDYGIIEEVYVEEHTIIKIDSGNIYINNNKINSDNFYVEAFDIKDNIKIPNITYGQNDFITNEKSYDFILRIRLVIYRINKNGEKISNSTIYENRFSFIGK